MEPEGSLPCSQEPAICPCPQVDEPSPHPHILLFFRSFLYFPTIYVYLSQVVSFFGVSQLNFLVHFSCLSGMMFCFTYTAYYQETRNALSRVITYGWSNWFIVEPSVFGNPGGGGGRGARKHKLPIFTQAKVRMKQTNGWLWGKERAHWMGMLILDLTL
jgi:hypothetical protein